ncbi:MAG: SUMF1/EgtB/PvdO family nonheme iron enzyme [Chloroflexi bacterium]|nr:SUMF1/EgtB/PvdO family nonheme iron enzyme [Chloroflexota bacterium]
MSDLQNQIDKLQEQIESLEKLRQVLGDDVVDEKQAEIQAKIQAKLRPLIETGGGAVVTGNVDTGSGDFVGRDKTVNIYQGRYEGYAPGTTIEAYQIYCQYVAQQAGALPLRGMDRVESDASTQRRSLSLSSVYTSLDITLTTTEKAMQAMLSQGRWIDFNSEGQDHKTGLRMAGLPQDTEDEKGEMHQVSALEAAILSRKWILLGDPGSGKTTFVNYLTQALAHGDFGAIPAWPQNERDIVPIVVILRDYYRWAQTQETQTSPNHLWAFICHDLKTKNLGFAEGILNRALEHGKAILMLDGLDEVPPGAARGQVRDCVLVFHQRYPRNRFLITCRVLSYQNTQWQLPKADFLSFELASFSAEKIEQFINAWYNEVAQKWNVSAARTQALAEKLLDALQRSDLARLAPNPLLLTVMVLVHTEYGELPDNRAQLYHQAVDVLLWRWEQEKSKDLGGLSKIMSLLQAANRDRNDLLLILGRLAFEAHLTGGDTDDQDAVSGISNHALLIALRELHPERSLDWAEQVVEAMRLRAGLLLDRDGTVFTFPHRTFQEYLAGTHLSLITDFPLEACKLVEAGSFWRVVILLAVGHLAHNMINRSLPLMLVNELCPGEDQQDELAWNKAVLAGEALLELGINRAQDSETGKSALKRVRNRLAEIVEKGLWTATRRAEAGGLLGRLGDPRFDPKTFYLPKTFRSQPEETLGFVRIPAGSFVMGSKKGEKDAFSNEQPQHEVELPEFRIARYPVTVAQYRAFVNEAGHKTADQRSITENPNWPVRYVSWHDARAYCQWLTEKLSVIIRQQSVRGLPGDAESRFWQGLAEGRLIVRLPTEAEWEKASRYGDTRRYPWGNGDWDEEKANIGSSGLGHPSPVGMYTQGATPNSLMDMSGNVWEWSRSLKKDYPYYLEHGRNDPEASGSRVVRGGSWILNLGNARCAYRFRLDTDLRYDGLGFRIVMSPT